MKYFLDLFVFLIPVLYIIITNLWFLNEKLYETTSQTESIDVKPNVLNSCTHVVNTNTGRVRGCAHSTSNPITNHKTVVVYSFKGIPYAEPPVGKLRFQKTVPKVSWGTKVVDATNYRSPCMQQLLPDWPFPSGLPSEDCLFLNVWSPRMDSRANLPVMLWIHGGSFFSGSGSQYVPYMGLSLNNIYDGTLLAVKDVVVITINYRLGVFGFLYGNRSDCPGNMGYWDQAMALNWTKQNIHRFGGNPNDITLFGGSAGSMAVSNHIVSNVTRNWFQRAILQSGTAYIKQFSKDKDYAYGVARSFASNSTLLKSGVCDDDNNWIDCLRNKSALELIARQTTSSLWSDVKPWYVRWLTPFLPIYGDEFIPLSVNKAVKEGNFRNDIKILLGHNEMEGLMFTFAIDLIKFLFGRYSPFLPISTAFTRDIVYNDIKNLFIDNETIGALIADKYTEGFPKNLFLKQNHIRSSAVYSFSDFYLNCPTVLFGGHMAKAEAFTGKVFQYRFTHTSSQSISKFSVWSEATHNDELPFLFGKPFQSIESMSWFNSDRIMSQLMINIWTHFAKYDSLPKVNGNQWPEYSIKSDGNVSATYLELNPNSERLGRVFVDRYNGFDNDLKPNVINNCFGFWDKIISDQF